MAQRFHRNFRSAIWVDRTGSSSSVIRPSAVPVSPTAARDEINTNFAIIPVRRIAFNSDCVPCTLVMIYRIDSSTLLLNPVPSLTLDIRF